jgi:hypothetical protein
MFAAAAAAILTLLALGVQTVTGQRATSGGNIWNGGYGDGFELDPLTSVRITITVPYYNPVSCKSLKIKTGNPSPLLHIRLHLPPPHRMVFSSPDPSPRPPNSIRLPPLRSHPLHPLERRLHRPRILPKRNELVPPPRPTANSHVGHRVILHQLVDPPPLLIHHRCTTEPRKHPL